MGATPRQIPLEQRICRHSARRSDASDVLRPRRGGNGRALRGGKPCHRNPLGHARYVHDLRHRRPSLHVLVFGQPQRAGSVDGEATRPVHGRCQDGRQRQCGPQESADPKAPAALQREGRDYRHRPAIEDGPHHQRARHSDHL